MNPKVDKFLEKAKKWQPEMTKLRELILDSGLDEDFKWMHPCYSLQGKNIVLIHGFKEYCAILFHKGALLNDEANVLIQQTENVQSARQMRFANLAEIEALESTIKTYVYEAIEVEKAGLEVKLKKTSEYEMPEELQNEMENDIAFKTAFGALTTGRQRGYILYFSAPKQSKTRLARIEKCYEKIFKGEGYKER